MEHSTMNLVTVCVLLCIVSAGGILCKDDRNYNINPDMLKFLPMLGVDGSTVELIQTVASFLQFFNFTAANVSEDCAKSMKIVFASAGDALNSSNTWAMKMLDASAKIPSGFLQGGMPIFGAFDECLSVSADPSQWTQDYNKTIKGQYCNVRMASAAPPGTGTGGGPGQGGSLGPLMSVAVYFRYDVCLPTACSLADINKALAHHIKSAPLGIILQATACERDDPVVLTQGQVAAITVFSILGFFLLVGTVLDLGLLLLDHFYENGLLKTFSGKTWVTALTSFSLYKNGLKLLDTRSSAGSLSAVNGIRFLSMTWVILGHCYAYVSFAILGNLLVMDDLQKDFALQAILNGFLAVDSFFFLSGLLLAYVTIKELSKGGRLNGKFFAMFYFHRFWRLTPAVLFTSLFVILWPLIASGPTWTATTLWESANCAKNWWVNLLYIQNFKSNNRCLGHGWYLADDMQFYVLSPIILVTLYLNRNLGLAVNTLFLLGTSIATGVISRVNEYPATILLSDLGKMPGYYQNIYIKPWCRIGPFCVGIYLGYFLALKRDYKLSKPLLALGWSLAIVCSMSTLYGIHPWSSGHLPTQGVADFYSSMHRTAWAAGLAWVTFACATGYGGIVNRILSWAPFGPLGRMSYMAYLFHPFIQFTYSGMVRERVIYTHYLYVVMFLGFMVVSYGVAFVASLAFEAPFLGLEKVIFKRPSAHQNPTPLAQTNNQGVINHALNPDQENGVINHALTPDQENGVVNKGLTPDQEKANPNMTEL